MADIRECVQCGTAFTPRREHARFCSTGCRVAWNKDHDGVGAAPDAAIGWSVTGMSEAVERFARAGTSDLTRAATALSEAVWWITLVDATLVRYHPREYETTLRNLGPEPRRKTEEDLTGLRYVRNQIGRATDPAQLIHPAGGSGGGSGWAWSPLPEPALAGLPKRAREWELSRYHAYQSRLADGDVIAIFARCTTFLEQTAAAASADDTPASGARTAR